MFISQPRQLILTSLAVSAAAILAACSGGSGGGGGSRSTGFSTQSSQVSPTPSKPSFSDPRYQTTFSNWQAPNATWRQQYSQLYSLLPDLEKSDYNYFIAFSRSYVANSASPNPRLNADSFNATYFRQQSSPIASKRAGTQTAPLAIESERNALLLFPLTAQTQFGRLAATSHVPDARGQGFSTLGVLAQPSHAAAATSSASSAATAYSSTYGSNSSPFAEAKANVNESAGSYKELLSTFTRSTTGAAISASSYKGSTPTLQLVDGKNSLNSAHQSAFCAVAPPDPANPDADFANRGPTPTGLENRTSNNDCSEVSWNGGIQPDQRVEDAFVVKRIQFQTQGNDFTSGPQAEGGRQRHLQAVVTNSTTSSTTVSSSSQATGKETPELIALGGVTKRNQAYGEAQSGKLTNVKDLTAASAVKPTASAAANGLTPAAPINPQDGVTKLVALQRWFYGWGGAANAVALKTPNLYSDILTTSENLPNPYNSLYRYNEASTNPYNPPKENLASTSVAGAGRLATDTYNLGTEENGYGLLIGGGVQPRQPVKSADTDSSHANTETNSTNPTASGNGSTSTPPSGAVVTSPKTTPTDSASSGSSGATNVEVTPGSGPTTASQLEPTHASELVPTADSTLASAAEAIAAAEAATLISPLKVPPVLPPQTASFVSETTALAGQALANKAPVENKAPVGFIDRRAYLNYKLSTWGANGTDLLGANNLLDGQTWFSLYRPDTNFNNLLTGAGTNVLVFDQFGSGTARRATSTAYAQPAIYLQNHYQHRELSSLDLAHGDNVTSVLGAKANYLGTAPGTQLYLLHAFLKPIRQETVNGKPVYYRNLFFPYFNAALEEARIKNTALLQAQGLDTSNLPKETLEPWFTALNMSFTLPRITAAQYDLISQTDSYHKIITSPLLKGQTFLDFYVGLYHLVDHFNGFRGAFSLPQDIFNSSDDYWQQRDEYLHNHLQCGDEICRFANVSDKKYRDETTGGLKPQLQISSPETVDGESKLVHKKFVANFGRPAWGDRMPLLVQANGNLPIDQDTNIARYYGNNLVRFFARNTTAPDFMREDFGYRKGKYDVSGILSEDPVLSPYYLAVSSVSLDPTKQLRNAIAGIKAKVASLSSASGIDRKLINGEGKFADANLNKLALELNALLSQQETHLNQDLASLAGDNKVVNDDGNNSFLTLNNVDHSTSEAKSSTASTGTVESLAHAKYVAVRSQTVILDAKVPQTKAVSTNLRTGLASISQEEKDAIDFQVKTRQLAESQGQALNQRLRESIIPAPAGVQCGYAMWSCVVGFHTGQVFDGTNLQLVHGSSFATPTVTGMATIVKQTFPWMSGANLKTTLTTTAFDLGAPGVDQVYGWGLVNLANALRGPRLLTREFIADLALQENPWDYQKGSTSASVPKVSTFVNDIAGTHGLVVNGWRNHYLALTGNVSSTGTSYVYSGNLVFTSPYAWGISNSPLDLVSYSPQHKVNVLENGALHVQNHRLQKVKGVNGGRVYFDQAYVGQYEPDALTETNLRVRVNLADYKFADLVFDTKKEVTGQDADANTKAHRTLTTLDLKKSELARIAGVDEDPYDYYKYVRNPDGTLQAGVVGASAATSTSTSNSTSTANSTALISAGGAKPAAGEKALAVASASFADRYLQKDALADFSAFSRQITSASCTNPDSYCTLKLDFYRQAYKRAFSKALKDQGVAVDQNLAQKSREAGFYRPDVAKATDDQVKKAHLYALRQAQPYLGIFSVTPLQTESFKKAGSLRLQLDNFNPLEPYAAVLFTTEKFSTQELGSNAPGKARIQIPVQVDNTTKFFGEGEFSKITTNHAGLWGAANRAPQGVMFVEYHLAGIYASPAIDQQRQLAKDAVRDNLDVDAYNLTPIPFSDSKTKAPVRFALLRYFPDANVALSEVTGTQTPAKSKKPSNATAVTGNHTQDSIGYVLKPEFGKSQTRDFVKTDADSVAARADIDVTATSGSGSNLENTDNKTTDQSGGSDLSNESHEMVPTVASEASASLLTTSETEPTLVGLQEVESEFSLLDAPSMHLLDSLLPRQSRAASLTPEAPQQGTASKQLAATYYGQKYAQNLNDVSLGWQRQAKYEALFQGQTGLVSDRLAHLLAQAEQTEQASPAVPAQLVPTKLVPTKLVPTKLASSQLAPSQLEPTSELVLSADSSSSQANSLVESASELKALVNQLGINQQAQLLYRAAAPTYSNFYSLLSNQQAQGFNVSRQLERARQSARQVDSANEFTEFFGISLGPDEVATLGDLPLEVSADYQHEQASYADASLTGDYSGQKYRVGLNASLAGLQLGLGLSHERLSFSEGLAVSKKASAADAAANAASASASATLAHPLSNTSAQSYGLSLSAYHGTKLGKGILSYGVEAGLYYDKSEFSRTGFNFSDLEATATRFNQSLSLNAAYDVSLGSLRFGLSGGLTAYRAGTHAFNESVNGAAVAEAASKLTAYNLANQDNALVATIEGQSYLGASSQLTAKLALKLKSQAHYALYGWSQVAATYSFGKQSLTATVGVRAPLVGGDYQFKVEPASRSTGSANAPAQATQLTAATLTKHLVGKLGLSYKLELTPQVEVSLGANYQLGSQLTRYSLEAGLSYRF